MVSVETRHDVDPGNNQAWYVPVSVVSPEPLQTVSGVVYGDADGDGRFDDGEGLSDVPVKLGRGLPVDETTSGSDGRFTFTDVPRGVYELEVPQLDTWVGPYTYPVRVDGTGEHTDLELRRSSPVSKTLEATLSFDEDSYQPGDTAHVTFTLTNKGDRPLTGVTAYCGGIGDSRDLDGVNEREHFGELVWDGDGVTIAAGATETYHVTGVVREGAADYGYVSLGCSFGPKGTTTGHPWAYDTAKVPGRTGKAAAVVLYHDRDGDYVFDDGEVVSGVTVGIRDRDADSRLLTAVTDEHGRASFGEIPAGVYDVEVFGEWRIRTQLRDGLEFEPSLPVHAQNEENENTFAVVPGPYKPLPEEGDGAGDSPAGAPSKDTQGPDERADDVDELASTGVDALTLGGVGAAVLLAGAVTVVIARRRRVGGSAE